MTHEGREEEGAIRTSSYCNHGDNQSTEKYTSGGTLLGPSKR